MPGAKKFGTFGGVFTPAILTILGVIMYLRLPWIVGQAGLFATIGIIVLAHVISITTGLSVSSISTDKRVKTGGTYYMISRSLGLPIGGTLGLALYIGLSFSVSLYLIGFSESFLGFWGFEVTKNTIRVAGTIALVAVTAITFISTNLALKTQFFILLAIGLSLGSILLGKPSANVSGPLLSPIAGGASLIVLFGIFFPAVTGFEAGVSMSGDLEDPKKSIPLGTILAISFGMVVYIGMAIFLSMRVSSQQLVNNSNILLDISLFSPLVLAGIWGATLSSALGSILGAPRILQAISIDKITPRIFGLGFGKENEPRNALLLTFVIAEAGILVGELDVIARIVSMFFITTYGFLNMSCAIENWASPDFRPDFRIPKTISIIGAVTCLVVMIQLDLVAMIGATVLLFSLYFYLKRKELTLESGDTWEGVWSSIIREGLSRLNRNKGQQRNWRPNIILFSGGTSARPHLLNLGKRLVFKRGILSNFDLLETAGSKTVFRKWEQSVKLENEEFEGVFARRVECEDIYATMETISKFYGFSGLEPNTVLMGWGRNSRKPEQFVRLIQTLSNLDYNLMLLNYDEVRGFGKYQRIDIWWRGLGNMSAFAFSLCRFLTGSDEWQNAEIRFLVVTEDSSMTEKLHTNMNQIVMDYRIDATVKVINNAVEQTPFYDMIKWESRNADLIINGIPSISQGEEQLYVNKINSIIDHLGTVLLIRASSFFSDMDIGIEPHTQMQSAVATQESQTDAKAQRIDTDSLSETSANAVRRIESLISTINQHFQKAYLGKSIEITSQWVEDFKKLALNAFATIEKGFTDTERVRNHKVLLSAMGDFIFQTQRLTSEIADSKHKLQREYLEEGLKWVLSRIDAISGGVPERLQVPRSKEALRLSESDAIMVKSRKLGKRFQSWLLRKPAISTVQFRKLSEQYLDRELLDIWSLHIQQLILTSLQIYPELQRAVDHIIDSLGKTGTRLLAGSEQTFEFLVMEKDRIEKELDEILDRTQQRYIHLNDGHALESRKLLEGLMADLSRFDSHSGLLPSRKIKRRQIQLIEKLNEMPDIWETNHGIMLQTTGVDLTILSFRNRSATIVKRAKGDIRLNIENGILDGLNGLLTYMEQTSTSPADAKTRPNLSFKNGDSLTGIWKELVREIRAALDDLPETMDSVEQSSMQQTSEENLQPFQKVTLSLRRLVAFYFESEFIGPVSEEIEEVAAIVEKAIGSAQDIVRLVSLNLNEVDKTDEHYTVLEENPLETIRNDALSRTADLTSTVVSLPEKLEKAIDSHLKNTFENLNLYSLLGTEENKEQPHAEKRFTLLLPDIKTRLNKLSRRITNLSTSLLYRHSSVATDIHETVKKIPIKESAVRIFLEAVEAASPKPDIVSSLPFYYRHLFLGKPSITRDFWVGRQSEIAQAGKAVQRFQAGLAGGLAIIGEPASGKTALSQVVAARFFEKQKVFFLSPPEEGSIDLKTFRSRLSALFKQEGRIDQLFQRLPQNSTIILDDVARWWERSTDGFAVINEIIRLIQQFGNRCFIIINLNSHTYGFINRVREFDSSFLGMVYCPAFDIPALKEIILLRHRSTGLRFVHDNRHEDTLNKWHQARIFTRLLKNTSGNVGTALAQWIRSIQKVGKDELHIEPPVEIETGFFSLLKPDQVTIMIQFLLHGCLGRHRLDRIMGINPNRLMEEIMTLKRSGLLTENRVGVYQINPYIEPNLIRYLRRKRWL